MLSFNLYCIYKYLILLIVASADGISLQFEDGYIVETVVKGNELGIIPYRIRISQEGELFAVDADKSNIVRITPPLTQCKCFSHSSFAKDFLRCSQFDILVTYEIELLHIITFCSTEDFKLKPFIQKS